MRDELKEMSPFAKTCLALIGALLLWKFFGVGEWLKFFFTIVLFPFAFLGFCVDDWDIDIWDSDHIVDANKKVDEE